MRNGRLRAGPRGARLLVALAGALAAATLLIGAGPASALVVCDPTVQDCAGQERATAQLLFSQLNTDVAVFPDSPWKTATQRAASDAEALYPPSPFLASDFCPSFGAFGALQGYASGLVNAAAPAPVFPPASLFPPSPFLVAVPSQVAAIRSAAIWTFWPPAPTAPPQTAACTTG